MTINLNGLERYQSHQQGGSEAARKTAETPQAGHVTEISELDDDAVSLSDVAVIVEWIAQQSPNLSAPQAAEPANLGRLSDHLLRYNLISLPEAGRLMSLVASEEAVTAKNEALNGRIQWHAGESESWQEKQQWQKLDRLVSTLTAAQSIQPHQDSAH